MKLFTETRSCFYLIICMVLILNTLSAAQEKEPAVKLPELPSDSLEGKFEIDVHYSTWSVNLIKSLFEADWNDRLGREIRDEVSRQISDTYTGIYNADYEHSLTFDSDGIWFPTGRFLRILFWDLELVR